MESKQKLFIDNDKCLRCGVCASVCPARIFEKNEKGMVINKFREKYCITCGDCVSVCPKSAVKNTDVLTESINDIMPFIVPSQLVDFFKKRRSIRSYKDQVLSEYEKQFLTQIACLSPRGGHTHSIRNTEFVIVENKELLAQIVKYTYNYLYLLNKKLSSFWIKIPMAFNASFRNSINNTCRMIEQTLAAKAENIDMLTYGAPSLILLHSEKGSPVSRENLTIMEYQMMIGAETLDLGTCFLGWVSFALQSFQVKMTSELKAIYSKLGITKNREVLSAFAIGKKRGKYYNVKARSSMNYTIL